MLILNDYYNQCSNPKYILGTCIEQNDILISRAKHILNNFKDKFIDINTLIARFNSCYVTQKLDGVGACMLIHNNQAFCLTRNRMFCLYDKNFLIINAKKTSFSDDSFILGEIVTINNLGLLGDVYNVNKYLLSKKIPFNTLCFIPYSSLQECFYREAEHFIKTNKDVEGVVLHLADHKYYAKLKRTFEDKGIVMTDKDIDNFAIVEVKHRLVKTYCSNKLISKGMEVIVEHFGETKNGFRNIKIKGDTNGKLRIT